MLRKSLIGAVAVLGIALAGSVAGAQPASAGYACGPWNGWCSYYYVYPGWGWYGNKGHNHWNKGHNNNWNKYGHKNWDNDWHKGKGKGKGHAYKNGNWNKYH
jgi:hypothetical protein